MKTIIASGPVIIENKKVLLNKERKDYGITPWLFPGGKAEEGETNLETICRREVKEEMGIEIEIIKQLHTIEAIDFFDKNKKYILHHFLAKRIGDITIGDDVVEYGWFDINNLPADCSPNVYEIIADFRLQNAE